jgi:apolipoprotein N-acyltransferase
MSADGASRGSIRDGFLSRMPWILALVSGILTGLCFPPWENRWLSWLPWVSLAPLCWALWMLPRPSSATAWGARSFLLGWLTGAVSFLISLFWITTVTIPGWIALSLIVGLYHALWALFAGLVLRPLGEAGGSGDARATSLKSSAWLGSFRNLLVALLAAAAWTAVEWLRGTLFSGFGWNTLGIALRGSIPMIQIAGITGVAGLTFLCVFGAATAAITVERLRREILLGRSRPHLDFLISVLLVVLVFGYGVKKLTAPAADTEPLRVAAVQGNVPVYDYWDPKCENRILDGYVRQTRMALVMDPDLVVWPEAATPRPLLLDEITYGQVKGLAAGSRADFLIGSTHYEEQPRGDFNSAILLTKHAGEAQIYNKVHLVPFGEFVPFRKLFPPLAWIVGDRVKYDFDPGKGPALLELAVKPVKLGPLICFEDTLGDLARRSAALGAQLLVTLTNDGWFEHSVATRQHLANCQIRTVETGLPLLRAADTGITCQIDRFGRIQEMLRNPDGNTFIEGILQTTVAVPVNPEPTWYTLHGDLFAHACLGITLASAAAALLSARRRS